MVLLLVFLFLGACASSPEQVAVTAAPVTNHPPVQFGTSTPAPDIVLAPTKALVSQAAPTFTQPAPTPTASPAPLLCREEAGRIEQGSTDTALLREPLEYRIYLPPCYDLRPDLRYPVLYMFHGQGFRDNQWDRIGIDEAADRLITAGEIPPLLIVMPHDRSFGQPNETEFDRAFLEELIPLIDRTYRTIPERSARAVGGLSRGGALAVHFGIAYWPYFGALGAHSPAIFHYDGKYLERWLDAIPPGSYPRIYIDIGDRDLPEITGLATWFESLLEARDIPHEWRLFTGNHSETYWKAHVEAYLRWYTQGW